MPSPTQSGRYPDPSGDPYAHSFTYFDEDLKTDVEVRTNWMFGICDAALTPEDIPEHVRHKVAFFDNFGFDDLGANLAVGQVKYSVPGRDGLFLTNAFAADKDGDYDLEGMYAHAEAARDVMKAILETKRGIQPPRWYGIRSASYVDTDGRMIHAPNYYIDPRLTPPQPKPRINQNVMAALPFSEAAELIETTLHATIGDLRVARALFSTNAIGWSTADATQHGLSQWESELPPVGPVRAFRCQVGWRKVEIESIIDQLLVPAALVFEPPRHHLAVPAVQLNERHLAGERIKAIAARWRQLLDLGFPK